MSPDPFGFPEDGMVNSNRVKILRELGKVSAVKKTELIKSGFEAAQLTITMMRTVFNRIPPRKIVDFYINSDAKPKQLSEDIWNEFGDGTIECMKDGVHMLAVLWQSAWVAGDGDTSISASARKAITKSHAMKICQDADFLPSVGIADIQQYL
ncbi:hypothetical protein [Schlesneria paludicola]|uniref:hypothetical protein n=1 Tax=Schlesneria paludicola TaxID=360056 RepID=UPI00029B348F|nr:hypothetical protein [Schlesneria paludicola]